MVSLEPFDFGLSRLPDNSLVVEDQYQNRYGRGSFPDPLLGVTPDKRTETERDRGRLAYAPSIRRLADLVMSQLHSRATHTYKVAMVSREVAEHVTRKVYERGTDAEGIAAVIAAAGGLDIAACEAAGLAHDLGHPPFGHAGEEALDALLLDGSRTQDGFEGNAQSFRIVSQLERVKVNKTTNGLDLTNVTLAAILKYPWVRKAPFSEAANRKFGAYLTEDEDRVRVRRALGLHEVTRQSLEASVMDLADDIAYAIHDLEDFLAAGVISPSSVLADLRDAISGVRDNADFNDSASPDDPFTRETHRLRGKYPEYFNDEAYLAALKYARSVFEDVPEDYDDPLAPMLLRTTLAGVVKELFAALSVTEEGAYANGPRIYLAAAEWHNIQVLKTVTKRFLVNRSPMGSLQRTQAEIVRVVFDKTVEWLGSKPEEHHLPIPLRRVMGTADVGIPSDGVLQEPHYRAIADYVCTMSDSEAALRARYLSGADIPGPAELGIHP